MDDQTLWEAVAARDARWDGRFVYAVRSTGVYCRPSCPSRRPGRAQVRFFPLPELAEAEGFRPCRRCHPRRADWDPRLDRVRRVLRLIEEEGEGPLRLAALAARAGASPYHLQREFKRALGVTPRQYAEARRAGRLKGLLRAGASIAFSLYEAGYGSPSRLYEKAGALLGMTPGGYRRGGAGMLVRYATAPCALGRLLVAATPRGVCAVQLGDSDAHLEREIRREFPRAEVARDEEGVGGALKAILRLLDGKTPSAALPLDVRATAFQRRVWEHLQTIPAGETRSYARIARALGVKNGARAVGSACASNPVALLVPCHRAVR
ncbi:MAG: bifunctional DNA-binding transcriptional regulator/O6-methylguanine-DNA methyltransferase Ada, partial [Candidatus Tectomicrobia bacterium]|nr:bifunctional DNA-binding transcriptional regulator/O6-methylguanine-DNA methyltransferase Ada [Candidatus Tectomicrobia bacterium]